MALTVEKIRAYVKDDPELNILLENRFQSSELLVELAMDLAISDFNGMAPVTNFVAKNFPNDAILLYGTLHHLANSEAERQLRNQVNYSAQGLNAGIDDKMGQYNQLAAYYKQMFETRAEKLKIYFNQQAAWGESFSPYVALSEMEFRSDS